MSYYYSQNETLANRLISVSSLIRGRPLMIWGAGGNFRNEFIFSREPLLYFFLESVSQNLFFLGEGPPKFFFLDFLRPHPQIITGRPLIPTPALSWKGNWHAVSLFCVLFSERHLFKLCLHVTEIAGRLCRTLRQTPMTSSRHISPGRNLWLQFLCCFPAAGELRRCS